MIVIQKHSWILLIFVPTIPALVHADDRLPIPDAAAQKEAAALVKELFGDEIENATTPDQELALTKKLLEESSRPDTTPAGRFALLRSALDNASDASAAMPIVDEMAKHFQIDSLKAKASTVWRFSQKARTSSQHSTVAEATLQLVDESVNRDAYDPAIKLAEIAMSAAQRARDGKLVLEVRTKTLEVSKLKADFEKVQEAMAVLEKEPTNAEANLKVGTYKCLVKGDWEDGVPMLALGTDEVLKDLAVQELKGPTTGNAQATLADGWWELAESHAGREQPQIRLHARRWYQKAMPKLIGLQKKKVENRLAITDFPNEAEQVKNKVAKPHASDAVRIGDHFYKVISKEAPVSWSMALEECQQMGGYLACLETAEEQMSIDKLRERKVVWVGGFREKNGRFVWINGRPIKQRVLIDNAEYRYVASRRGPGINVRPESGRAPNGHKPFPVPQVNDFVCEWDK